MPYIDWNETLHVGIKEIDDQHAYLVSIINRLWDAWQKKQDKKILQEILGEVHDYVKYHFESEQQLMDRHPYPAMDEHISQHEDYILKSTDFLTAYQEGNEELTPEVLDYLTGWWKTHMNGTDKAMARAWQASGEADRSGGLADRPRAS